MPTSPASDAPRPESLVPVDPATGQHPQAGRTRRSFIRGVAAAGASTAAAVALDGAGITDLLGDSAVAAGPPTRFSEFTAIAASSADQVQVPEGFRADVLIKWGDEFANSDGTKLRYGFNNDFLAFLKLDGKPDEGLLFVNHEYPAPFFQHGNKDPKTKTEEQIALEKDAVGNSILHIRRVDGLWQVVSPSPYNRRITGGAPACEITGPLRGTTQVVGGANLTIETTAAGSLANCSGGITPWGTTLSCEENYDGYWGDDSAFAYGWKHGAGNDRYDEKTFAHYGWVVEHDPYDPSSTPRKHTALGRFRHENTAFRHVAGKKFVLYMGDDKAGEGVYKFVSDREFLPGRRSHNLRILEQGTLYIAKWSPEGRRRFASQDAGKAGGALVTPESGSGEWVKVEQNELVDTAALLRARIGSAQYDLHFATNRPEDVEVDADGTVYVSFTNNTGSNVWDYHGSIRKLVEAGNDPTALTFTWQDYADGGPTGRAGAGEQGFSSCDNLVFDSANNLWVVTDISSSSLNKPSAAHYQYHQNNAVFMIPRSGPNAGVAFRFANMPVEAEGTGPYFDADESTLFVNVQHPGEETPASGGVYGDPATYSSWWPAGNKTAGVNPSLPRPATVAITRVKKGDDPGDTTIPPGPGPGPDPKPGQPSGKTAVDVPEKVSLATLLSKGVKAKYRVREAARIEVILYVRLPKVGRLKSRLLTVARVRKTVQAGSGSVTLRPGTVARAALRTRRGRTLRGQARLIVKPVDGTPKVVRRSDAFTIR
ncbi:PhoX family protein [Patulibacter defluvii]|uniref:PhoX family protein n=1 Tax=Patulibacter defluvii TaxID=3095358 RepID=UPI002A75BC87|nr:alkaline phosphatase PhoX [Patulibacter sp. DM4]